METTAGNLLCTWPRLAAQRQVDGMHDALLCTLWRGHLPAVHAFNVHSVLLCLLWRP